MRSLSVVIPNYNGAELLPKFMPYLFEALARYAGAYEVIIVDDCSTDDSRTAMENVQCLFPHVVLLHNPQNLGFSGTCNVGIWAARYEIVFLFNNDVEIEPDYFQYFNPYFDDPQTFAVTCCGYFYHNRQPLDGIKLAYWRLGLPRLAENVFNDQLRESAAQPPYRSFVVQGAYFFADAAKLRQLEGFDELISPFIYEETDLAYRAIKRGWRIYYEPRCVGYHQQNTSIDKVSSQRRKLTISQRNRILFVWKNIHDWRYLASHTFFMGIKVLTFNRRYISALWQARQRWPELRAKRRREKREAVISDRALFDEFGRYQRRFFRKS